MYPKMGPNSFPELSEPDFSLILVCPVISWFVLLSYGFLKFSDVLFVSGWMGGWGPLRRVLRCSGWP